MVDTGKPKLFRSFWGNIIVLSGIVPLSVIITACAPKPVFVPSMSVDEKIDGRQIKETSIRDNKTENVFTGISLSVPRSGKSHSKSGAPLTSFVTANFVGSYRCAMCHEKLEDSEGRDVSISNHWRSTMMANAAKDPFWQAKVKSEVQRHPALAKVIEEKCVSCHMPMAWTQAAVKKKQFRLYGVNSIVDEFLRQGTRLHQAAMDGVSCSLCHQIQDSGLGEPDSFSGQYKIDTDISAPDRPIFGPYRETYPDTMISTVNYTPIYGPHMNDSGLCATCHTLYTPYVDGAGNVAGEFPEQTVYLEWLHSDYGEPAGKRDDIGKVEGKGRLCQDCHMPHSGTGDVTIAMPAHKEVKEKEHFSQHHFVGGNVFMLNIMNDYIAPLQVTASTEKIQDTGKRTIAQLQGNSGRLLIREARKSRDQLTAVIQVENKAGHKFPTGFPSRRAWIHLTVLDGNGETVFESGQPRFDGSIAGDNSDEQDGFEPHYEVIDRSDQVQIYESVMRNTEGELTYTLLRGAGYLKDNRLLPRGFNKKTASADIGVYGRAVKDKNFIGGADRLTYHIKIGKQPGPFTIRAELLYTPISFAFIRDLKQDDHLPLVKRFWRYYDKADKTPVAIAAAQSMIL